MSAPVRIQLSRRKGWRKPPNTVVVARPSKWGNPFRIGDVVRGRAPLSTRQEIVRDAEHACRLFRAWLFNRRDAEHTIAPLRGRNLACWCKPGEPCHADVLLRVANEVPADV